MTFKWVYIGNIMGPAGNSAALGRFDGIDAALRLMDSYTLGAGDDAVYGIPFNDRDGYVAGGVTKNGRFNFEKPPLVQGVEGVSFQPVDAPGYAVLFNDKDGYTPFAIREDGTVEIFKGGAAGGGTTALAVANEVAGFTRSDRSKVACIGDSLFNGYYGGSSGQTADAVPAKLQALMPAGVTVYNLSTSGWTVDEVAIRIGALPLALTATGNSIPASGAVTVSIHTIIGWGTGVKSFTGTYAGIPGTLSRADGGTMTMTFTRTTAGAATPVADGTVFVPDQAGHSGETAVILLGRNDVAQSIIGAEPTVAAHIAAGVSRIVAWLSRDVKQVLILSVTTTTTEKSGTSGYTTVTTANDLLKSAYKGRFLDLRSYLVTRAIYDLGITPTTEDLANIAADTLPPSIMDPGAAGTGDGTHWSKATAVLVAAQIKNYFTPREWIRP